MDYVANFSDERDIWTQTGLANGVLNRAVPLDELVSESVFRASPMWNDLFRAHGDDTGHSLGLVHRFDGATMATSFHRAWSSGPFSVVEAARLDEISTDLHRIYRAREMIRAQTEQSGRLADMLDAYQDVVILVDGGARLVEASPAAMRILGAGDGIGLRQGRFVTADPATETEIRRAAAAIINRRPGGRAAFLAPRASGGLPWRILVLPAADARHCSLLLSAGDRDDSRRTQWMRECFALTPAELAIAQNILAGRTAEDIASGRGISVATVRTHIRHILEKSGVNRLAGFIALLNGMP